MKLEIFIVEIRFKIMKKLGVGQGWQKVANVVM